jgi:2',3'-cyclic-nucleotide 2'-phosphodiesterase / 3'-nucleotidase
MRMNSKGKITLTILETSDVHGAVLPINYSNNSSNELGLAKISTLVNKEKSKNERVIVIDNGDIIQGTPLTYYYSRVNSEGINPVIKVMNYIGYDAAVIGNHEFNYGQKILVEAIQASEFPWLSANIIDAETGKARYGKPYVIKTYEDGLKVAVLGLTTNYIPNWENPKNIVGLNFESALEAAKRWVTYLKEEEKADVIIAGYHGGFERDLETGEPTEKLTGENVGYEICMEVPEIDVLLTGHQHRTISGNQVNGVLVVQPSFEARGLGKAELTLEYENRWKITHKNSEVLSVEGIEPDKKVAELIGDYEKNTQLWLDKPIGRVKGDMTVKDPIKIRLKDNALIEFFNKVQMINSDADISSTSLFYDFAPGLKSEITMRDIVSNYIYPNTLRVLRVTGQDIRDALERSASYFETYDGKEIRVNKEFSTPKPQPYNYDMWEGISYKLNISRPFGSRVVELKYKGELLDMSKEYDVVMNNYRAGGGGDYLMFKDKPVIKDITIDVSELIANYILERGTIEAEVDNNWEVIHD